MSTKDIINVLESHNRQIVTVTLSSAKDCADFWGEYVTSVYCILPATEITDTNGTFKYCLDDKINELLLEFRQVDTLELATSKGKLLKRFFKYFKENTGLKLDDATMGLLGDKLQYYLSNQNNTYYADFTNVINWEDGKFGKDDSCWWETYGDSRDTFINNGGWGIRFYESPDDRDGIGRTWLIPANGCLYGFNFYGIERPKVSKILKSIFAGHGITLHYKQCHIYNSCDDTIPYINGHDESNNGFVLYVDGNEPSDEYDVKMETESREKCCHCNTSIDTDYRNYQIINDDYYCDDCANKLFSSCDKCGEYYDRDIS